MKVKNSIIVCKYTDKSSFKLTTQLIENIYNEAKRAKKEAVLELTINDWVVTATINKKGK